MPEVSNIENPLALVFGDSIPDTEAVSFPRDTEQALFLPNKVMGGLKIGILTEQDPDKLQQKLPQYLKSFDIVFTGDVSLHQITGLLKSIFE